MREVGIPTIWRSEVEKDMLYGKYKAKDFKELVVLYNKQPAWNEDTQAYVLNFKQRVTMPSVKNFQLIHPEQPDYIILQFGKVGKTKFTMDYQYPLSPFQAFALCLTSFDNKLACE